MEDSFETMDFSDQSAEVQCPACLTTMLFCTLCEIKCVGCSGCQGMLVDGESFARIVRALRSDYRGPDQIPARPSEEALRLERNCPACHSVMDTHPYYGPGNVVIDACRECALVWLDPRELSQIIRAPGSRK